MTLSQLAAMVDRSLEWVRQKLKQGMQPETILATYNSVALLKLRLSKAKRRGRPLRTTGGREISHEEFLRGLVQHQAIKDAS